MVSYSMVWRSMEREVGGKVGRWEGEGVLGKQEPHSGCGEQEPHSGCGENKNPTQDVGKKSVQEIK